MDLGTIATCDLVEALSHRKGVEYHWVEPYNVVNITTNGPARVLVVID